MSISFSGLSTGLDTDSIVSSLMEVESQSLSQLQSDKSWQQSRLSALTQLNGYMESFASRIADLDSLDDIRAKSATLESEDFFTADAETTALPGTYQVEVVSLAQVEKQVGVGVADKESGEFGTGTLSLIVEGEDAVSITIDAENNSLEGIMQAINDADAGVQAAIINDGSGSPYRLILTGEDTAKSFTLDSSGLSGGTPFPNLSVVQAAQPAHIRVDTIDIESDTNTISEALPGVTLELSKAEEGTTTQLTVASDTSGVKSKIQSFVSGYNSVVGFISGQSASEGSSAGILSGDSGVNTIKRQLQNLISSPVNSSGMFSIMSEIGLETQSDGTLKIDTEKLDEALADNLDSVEKLLVGEGDVDGVAVQFQEYLDSMTDSIDGFFAGREESINSAIDSTNDAIERMQSRLEKREATYYAQFAALETLMSTLNATSDYVGTQMNMLEGLWSSD